MLLVDESEFAERPPEILRSIRLGHDVLIMRAGSAVARIVPEAPAPVDGRREGAAWGGCVRVSDDFDEPLPPDIGHAFGDDE